MGHAVLVALTRGPCEHNYSGVPPPIAWEPKTGTLTADALNDPPTRGETVDDHH